MPINKKTLLKIVILTAIILSIISLFVPMIIMDYSDVLDDLQKQGYDVPKRYSKLETSILLWIHSVYNYNNPDSPPVHQSYRLFNLIEFEKGKPIDIESALININDQDILNKRGDFLFSTNIASLIYIAIFPIGLAIFIYLIYKGFKNIGIKKTKYFLYLGILPSVIFILFLVGNYLYLSIVDFNDLGYTKYITLGYGFYTVIASIILFFIAYILQQYFIKIPEKTVPDNADTYSAT